MARTVTGVDIGTRTARFLRGAWKGNTFHATGFAVAEHGERDLAGAWAAAAPPFKGR